MATIIAKSLFLQPIFSFGPMFTASTSTSFFNNQPFGYETIIPWNDAIETAYTAARGTPFTTAFTGDALTISPRNIETGTLGGRVEGIFTYIGHRATGDLTHAVSIWGIDVRLADIQRVALTADNADDQMLMRSLLAGNDVIRLGRFGDKVAGYGGNDLIYAGSGSDLVQGGRGADRLYGQDGSDTLIGGAGNDVLVGGKGADELIGGAGADRFVFAEGHLGLGIGARDTIVGWTTDDVLDFSRMDANSTLPGDQSFGSPRKTIFDFSQAHCITFRVSGDDLILQFETNNDGFHDYELLLKGQAGAYFLFDKDWETLNLIL